MNAFPARYDFASDNVAGAMPEVIDAIVTANAGHMAAYGADTASSDAGALICGLLDADAQIRFLSSGTAANSLALSCLAAPHEAVLCHEHAHVATDETGAPAFFGAGLGLVGLPGASGKIDPDALKHALGIPETARHQPPAALSITLATEYGTLYTAQELAALIGIAKGHGLSIHVDGARLANAAAAGFDLTSLARMGVDILVMGGTKAGAVPTEALVILNRAYARRLDMRMKHVGQLPSKARFLAAPWIGMLGAGDPCPWIARSAHANRMAHDLAAQLPFPLLHAVETNGVFVDMSEDALDRILARGWQVYRMADGSVRFMCSWATEDAAIAQLVSDIHTVL